MKFIKSLSKSIQQKRTDGANSFWCVYGDIEQDENGVYFYTEYSKDEPRVIPVDELPDEVKRYVLSKLTIQ